MSIISHIGLLGAYGVPFLLSSGSDNALVFFIYIGIVNIAVLIISLKKVWGSLLYSTFGLTWSIFALWVFFNHNGTLDMLSGTFYPALILFFLTFYSIVVLARLKHSSKFAHNLLIMVVTNALIAYSLGYHFINETTEGVSALTIYTGINALIHSAIAIVLYQFNINSRDKALYYLIIALAIGSATLMLPIAFDGAVLTTLWIVEAAILFTVGQLRSIIQYKRYSFVILIVAIISFIGDYISGRYDTDIDIDNPIFNSYFGSMLLFSAILYVIYHVNKNYTFNSDGLKEIEFDKLINYAMKFTGIGVLLALYFTFTCEIHIYWNFIENRAYESQAGGDYYGCRESCMALMRVLILIIGIYQKLFKSNKVTSIAIWTVLGFNLLCISDMYMLSKEHMAIRLFVWIATAIAIYLWKRSIDDSNRKGIIQFDMTLYSILLIALTTELLYFASNILDYSNGWSVWVPILWVVYGILLIAGGIRNKKKYLRLSAIAIIGVTLFKFLIFDIPRASSGAKVILLISIGVMLLIGSFIYTKHREKL